MPAKPEGRRVLVTGASGFVGTALSDALAGQGVPARLAVRDGEAALVLERRLAETACPSPEIVALGTLGAGTSWAPALAGIDTVVHLAGRAHVTREHATDPLAAYRAANVEVTRHLARSAAGACVRRLIYVSSVKVNGEGTRGAPYREEDTPMPEDAYGVSKREAEGALWEAAAHSALEVVVLRPCLIYGPGVRGNFKTLVSAVDRGIPLPLGSVRNRRSLLFVGNMVGALLLCIEHPAAAGRTFLLSDGEDLATPELVRRIGTALGRPARLVPVPPALLRWAGAFLGKSATVSRLVGSLQVDSSRIRRELGWRPAADVAQGLADTARWYRTQESRLPMVNDRQDGRAGDAGEGRAPRLP
jgi:nucleoside-diphosphate-sugar epimerase